MTATTGPKKSAPYAALNELMQHRLLKKCSRFLLSLRAQTKQQEPTKRSTTIHFQSSPIRDIESLDKIVIDAVKRISEPDQSTTIRATQTPSKTAFVFYQGQQRVARLELDPQTALSETAQWRIAHGIVQSLEKEATEIACKN